MGPGLRVEDQGFKVRGAHDLRFLDLLLARALGCLASRQPLGTVPINDRAVPRKLDQLALSRVCDLEFYVFSGSITDQ